MPYHCAVRLAFAAAVLFVCGVSEMPAPQPERPRSAWWKPRPHREQWIESRDAVPRGSRMGERGLFGRAVVAVYPWEWSDFPGRLWGLWALLGGRAKHGTIR